MDVGFRRTEARESGELALPLGLRCNGRVACNATAVTVLPVCPVSFVGALLNPLGQILHVDDRRAERQEGHQQEKQNDPEPRQNPHPLAAAEPLSRCCVDLVGALLGGRCFGVGRFGFPAGLHLLALQRGNLTGDRVQRLNGQAKVGRGGCCFPEAPFDLCKPVVVNHQGPPHSVSRIAPIANSRSSACFVAAAATSSDLRTTSSVRRDSSLSTPATPVTRVPVPTAGVRVPRCTSQRPPWTEPARGPSARSSPPGGAPLGPCSRPFRPGPPRFPSRAVPPRASGPTPGRSTSGPLGRSARGR